jgi:4-hydroxy-tetrahydrodipicolinate synthase
MPTPRPLFSGTGVALVTPFQADLSVDYPALQRIIEWVVAGGVDYLVSLGTTGESVTLSPEERHEVLRFTVQQAAGRVPVVAGFGGNDTRALCQSIAAADLSGVQGILSVSPYYNKPTQEGIYAHYRAVDEASPLPVILYNVPGRTGSNISAETSLRLARDGQRIVAIKEASGNFDQLGRLLRDRPEGFAVLSGDDALALPQLGMGIDGVISVIANGWPAAFSQLVRAGLEGRFEQARALHAELMDPTELLFREGNPGGIKCALAHRGLCAEVLRLPCYPVSESLRQAMAPLAAAAR